MMLTSKEAAMPRFCWTLLLLLAPAAANAQAGTASVSEPLTQMYAKALVENWVQFGGAGHQIYFYLPRTIRVTSRGTKTVWGVNMQSIAGEDSSGDMAPSRAEVMEVRRSAHMDPEQLEKYETYLLTKIQWEVDCVHQRLRILKMIDYDEEGGVLLSTDVNDKLEEPVPDSNGEGLLRAFCDPAHRNYFRDLFNGKPPKR